LGADKQLNRLAYAAFPFIGKAADALVGFLLQPDDD
jgi:hypothetical protein